MPVTIKIPLNSDNKPWAFICLKGFFAGLVFEGAYFLEELVLRRNFAFQNGLGLLVKTGKNTRVTP